MNSASHAYEHRCCWNCGADNYHAEEPNEGPRFQAFVICHEKVCPMRAYWEDYSDPVLDASEWHPVAERCTAWVSAEGIFPSTLISATRTDGSKT